MEIETISLDKLIQSLIKVKKELQNEGIDDAKQVKVFLSSDAEGNSYGTIASKNIEFSLGFVPRKDSNYGDALIIYPYEEGIELFTF